METPWGRWSVLQTRDSFQVKLLEVEPGQRLSLQTHRLRSEFWVVASGIATVTLDHHTYRLDRTGSTFVRPGQPHRIANDGTSLLSVVETQFGSYLGEDDIVRLEDDYERLQ